MADTKFMDFAEVNPISSDYILVGNTTNGVRKAQISNLWVPLSGNAGPVLSRNTDDSYLALNGGSGAFKGAYLELNGKDRAENAGSFSLTATDGTTIKTLRGTKDDLIWDGGSLNKAAVIDENLSFNGYRKLANGLIIMWGTIHTESPNTFTSVTTPIPFSASLSLQLSMFYNGTESPVATGYANANENKIYAKSSDVAGTINWFMLCV